jgi:hypothetical protein
VGAGGAGGGRRGNEEKEKGSVRACVGVCWPVAAAAALPPHTTSLSLIGFSFALTRVSVVWGGDGSEARKIGVEHEHPNKEGGEIWSFRADAQPLFCG